MLTGEDLMPFGKHKFTKLKEVPKDYLLWVLKELETHSKINMSLTNKLLLKYLKK